MTRFFDAGTKPPRSGWHYPLNGQIVSASSESALHAIIAKWQKNNAKFVSDDAITADLWAYWCGREPGRCGQAAEPSAANVSRGPLVQRDINPPFFGPIIWRMMNLLAARWDAVGNELFQKFVQDTVLRAMTCPDCINEWRAILLARPPMHIGSAKAACEWVLTAHNLVNQRKGARLYTYAEGVREYGFPLDGVGYFLDR